MAPPKKWDEDESSSEESSDESVRNQVQPTRKKFDDEEDESDVASNWDEAEDSEEERKKATAAAAAKAKADAAAAASKKSKAQRIEEHREANRQKKLAGQLDAEDGSDDEDEADRRARLRQSEQDSDMKHAEDLFGAAQGPNNRVKPIVIKDAASDTGTVDLTKIPLFKPATKTQFEALSEVLVPLLRTSSSKPHYSLWVGNFCKQICTDLPSAEIKKVASALTALSNEKMKEEKDKDKSGKKTKAAKTKVSAVMGRDAGRGGVDTEAYEDGLADDDFM